MNKSFDDRSKTDINSCSENILEGEEDFVLDLGSDMMTNVMRYEVCSPTNGYWCESVLPHLALTVCISH